MSLPIAALTLQTMTMGAMSVQMVEILGEPWFYAPSLARTLEYKDARDMLRGVPEDEKAPHSVRSLGGVQEATLVNEPGFYRVVMRSRSVVAEPFEERHAELLDRLRSVKGMVVLSGYPSDLYDQTLVDWQRVEMPARAAGSSRIRREVLWLSPAATSALDCVTRN